MERPGLMSATHPWSPHPPVWEWTGISKKAATRAREIFEERAAIIEHHGGYSQATAEIRAYCALVERMHEAGVFTLEQIEIDVARQVWRAERFQREVAWAKALVSRAEQP